MKKVYKNKTNHCKNQNNEKISILKSIVNKVCNLLNRIFN
jgi:hypothetical protein